ncbi:GGDEF domain-containing protein [Blautia schinkii]|nr:GGDEF domain-containing protein [Blautia schinkii]
MQKKAENQANLIIRSKQAEAVLQDFALLVFLACILAGALLIAASGGQARIENIVMFLVMGAGIILAAYKARYIAIVLGAVQTLFYTIYKIYQAVANGAEITRASYIWLVLPLLCIAAMLVFMNTTYKTEVMAEMLEEQLRNMVLVDAVTGLYNLKSMYMDLERQMAYSRRNELSLCLMVLELRYVQELKSILNANQFDELKKRMAEAVEDSVRLEDRLYAVDTAGSIGIICTCDKKGAEIMKGRILKKLGEKETFEDILDRAIRVDVRTGCVEYDKEKISNAIEFKQKAENELQYDV